MPLLWIKAISICKYQLQYLQHYLFQIITPWLQKIHIQMWCFDFKALANLLWPQVNLKKGLFIVEYGSSVICCRLVCGSSFHCIWWFGHTPNIHQSLNWYLWNPLHASALSNKWHQIALQNVKKWWFPHRKKWKNQSQNEMHARRGKLKTMHESFNKGESGYLVL